MEKLFFSSSVRSVFVALCAFGSPVATTAAVTVFGDPADYEAQREAVVGTPATFSTDRESAEELRLFANDEGFMLQEGRPIFQFDLSSVTESAAEANFSAMLLSGQSNTAFDIQIWGTSSNRSGPISSEDSGAGSQFLDADYELAHDAGDHPVDEQSTGLVTQDITDYWNARYDDFQDGGNSWIYLRLQPSNDFSIGSGVDGEFSFASADHAVEGNRPKIDYTAIPEPRHAAWLLLVGAGAMVPAGRRWMGSNKKN